MTVIVEKKNDVYLKIEADEDIRRELGQFFTFEVPGFKFMPQYRNRVWDGKIRLFSYATGQIYAVQRASNAAAQYRHDMSAGASE